MSLPSDGAWGEGAWIGDVVPVVSVVSALAYLDGCVGRGSSGLVFLRLPLMSRRCAYLVVLPWRMSVGSVAPLGNGSCGVPVLVLHVLVRAADLRVGIYKYNEEIFLLLFFCFFFIGRR